MRLSRDGSVTQREMLKPQIQIHSKHEFPSLENSPTTENDSIHLSYGLGWGLFETPYGKVFFKEGHDDGHENYVVGFPEKKIGLVIMTNSSNGEGIYQGLLENLIGDTFTPIEWEGFTPYDKRPPRPALKQHHRIQLSAAALERFVGNYSDPAHFPNVTWTIRREGDHLSFRENDEPKQDLLPESAVNFYSANSDDEYTFAADGSVIVLHTDGKDLAFKRIGH